MDTDQFQNENEEFERWEVVFGHFNDLFPKKIDEAVVFLQGQIQAAESQGDLLVAASLSHSLAVCHSCLGENENALGYFEQAERLAPRDGTYPNHTAAFSLTALQDPDRALQKADKAILKIAQRVDQHYALPDALGVKAVALLDLGRAEDALAMFSTFRAAASSGPMMPHLDLRFASRLLRDDVFVDGCIEYLEDCERFADTVKNEEMRKTATALLSKAREKGDDT